MVRNFNSHSYEYSKLCAIEPSYRYDGAQPFSEWQQEKKF